MQNFGLDFKKQRKRTSKKKENHEHNIHVEIKNFLDKKLPVDSFFFAIPNAGHRFRNEAMRLKSEGMKAGIPDICINYSGMAFYIEVKTDNGKLSESQKIVHKKLLNSGCKVSICRSVEETKLTLINWNIPLQT